MEAELDTKAFYDISYGLYVITSIKDGKMNGQIANTVFQVSNKPAKVAVSINKDNLTHDYIMASKVLAISTLEEQTPMPFIGLFGFKSGRDIDKLPQAAYTTGLTGSPCVTENALSYMEGTVIGSADALVAAVRSKAPGDTVTLTYVDPSGRSQTVQVTLGRAAQ
jgi:ferric-chelate reductase [NAD(P)H]